MRALVLALLWPLAVLAEDRPGEFDYYVLALSWSPSWCLREADPGHPQCDPARDMGWVLHGLWPQYETGWPSDCPRAGRRDPSREETAAMADIMGSGGSAWHQWKKHGRCAGLDPADYFALARKAYGAITRPQVLRDLDRQVRLPASVIEAAFLEANPGLAADGVTVTCKAGRIAEVRLCLTRDLAPRRCGADVIRDCLSTDAVLDPIP